MFTKAKHALMAYCKTKTPPKNTYKDYYEDYKIVFCAIFVDYG